MSYLIYVNMQKRGDGALYPDMHKTDERIYFSAEDAQKAIDADPELARYRHVVPILCSLESADDDPTYLIVFKQPISNAHVENVDRLYIEAHCIEEAVGIALMQNPTLTYNDILDHMEV